jgi:hypothetical protein
MTSNLEPLSFLAHETLACVSLVIGGSELTPSITQVHFPLCRKGNVLAVQLIAPSCEKCDATAIVTF